MLGISQRVGACLKVEEIVIRVVVKRGDLCKPMSVFTSRMQIIAIITAPVGPKNTDERYNS